MSNPVPPPARTVWLTGLPSAGKTTIASALVDALRSSGRRAELLDGDEVRRALSAELGFSRADRDANVARIGWVANLLSKNEIWAVAAVISPYRAGRDGLRAAHCGRFFEVWVATDVDECARRDVKGLYAAQRAGTLRGLTGVDDVYEPPLSAELVLPTAGRSVADTVATLWSALGLSSPCPPLLTGTPEGMLI